MSRGRRSVYQRPVPDLVFLFRTRWSVVAWPRADFTEGAGNPLRLCQDGKRKLTESAREFPKEFRLAKSERAVPGGVEAEGHATPLLSYSVPSVIWMWGWWASRDL